MKYLVKPVKFSKDIVCDGLVLPLKDYSVEYENYFSLDEIIKIRSEFNKDIFVVINRNFFNDDIDNLKDVLIKLDDIGITGIFFYDLAVLELKKELNLKFDLVLNKTFMVTNYKTCDYYYEKGVKYAYLSNEITKDEIFDIKDKSKINPIIMLFGYPTVATSRRKLITNYRDFNNLDSKGNLEIIEKVTNDKYMVYEDKYGTTFRYSKVLNNLEILEELKEKDFSYVVLVEDFIDHDSFLEVVDTIYNNKDFSKIYEKFGNNTGFLNKKTIYKVKKDG